MGLGSEKVDAGMRGETHREDQKRDSDCGSDCGDNKHDCLGHHCASQITGQRAVSRCLEMWGAPSGQNAWSGTSGVAVGKGEKWTKGGGTYSIKVKNLG